ncbi:MAG: LPS export ABC transporter permease LptG [Rhodospirillaceae bacterium]
MPPLSLLSRYFGRQFLMWFSMLLMIMLMIILVIDSVELLRRAAGKPEVTVGLVLRMSLFKLPGVGQQVVPFVVLFSAMFTFWRFTRSNELVVARAAGVSVWQFMTPVLACAFMIGVVKVTVVNPLGATLIAEYNRFEDAYLKRRNNNFDVTNSGLWVRQGTDEDKYLIHADSVVPGTANLRRVMVFRFADQDRYLSRLDAPTAQLVAGHWRISGGVLRQPNRPPQAVSHTDIPTELTLGRIEENFAPPETIPFWGLSRFIEIMESTGFSAIRHRLHYQSLLSQPLLYCAMVLLAAVFSLRQTRRGGTAWMVSGGIITGFALFIATDIVLTLGVSEMVPVGMAAWTPAFVSLLLGVSALLHQEDG